MLDVAPDTRLDHHELVAKPPECRGNWAVAQTRPQAERWAQSNLRRLGYETYLPLITVRRRDRAIRSLWHRVEIPLFPSYLFVQHCNPDLWRPIREAPGVQCVLLCGNRIQYARAGAVEALRADEALRAAQPPETSQWHPGAAVAVTAGAFFGHPAVIAAVTRKSAIITILIFGSPRNVTVPLSCLTRRE